MRRDRVFISKVDEPPAAVSALASVMRLVERFGLGNVIAVALLGFVLWFVHGELSANNDMLEKHVATTAQSNFLLRQTCIAANVLAGFPPASCDLPEALK